MPLCHWVISWGLKLLSNDDAILIIYWYKTTLGAVWRADSVWELVTRGIEGTLTMPGKDLKISMYLLNHYESQENFPRFLPVCRSPNPFIF